ncbi:MAG: asparagine synthase (glutamine-hydrolyzing) [Bacteroidota bacterium]
MCGICGIIDLQQQLPPQERQQRVQRMNEALWHRGPDEAGHFDDAYCHLAMRRLSIIDLAGGQQPQFSESGQIGVFQNGEIYNYQELRSELIDQGLRFQTQSDTEVLAQLYQAYGLQMLPRLKGMFSLCLFDRQQQKFILARDRFGEKPLYYHWHNGLLSYSSEIKSLLENPALPRRLNPEALPYYLRTSLVPEPITLLQGIQSLPPGHYLELAPGQFTIKPYFRPRYTVNPAIRSEAEAIELVRPHLLKAVQRQRVSDVPIGAFLSGGIDSSTVVALLQQQSDRPIKTFNVRFEDQAYDESPIARRVAEHCGTDHHEIVVPNYDFSEDIFWTIIDHVGLPFRDSSAIPSFLITQAIRKEVKVALSGDGGDELFGGYALFQWYQRIRALQQRVAEPVLRAAHWGLQLAQRTPGLSGVSKLRQLGRGVGTSLEAWDEIPIALNEMFSYEAISKLLGTKDQRPDLTLLKTYPEEAQGWSPLRKIMHYRMVHTLPANMLIKVDRMSMANSLEVRAPFLDPDLFEVSAQLPDEWLIHKGAGKYLIRKIMEKDLPQEVFTHPKTGFSIPLYNYQNKAFKKLARRLLFDENPLPDLFPKPQLEAIYHRGINTRQDTAQISVFQSAHQLWMMMQLLGWAERFKVEHH